MVASKLETLFDKGFVIIMRLVFLFHSVGTVAQYEEGGRIICKLN
jgi:hypothetical protein